MLTYDWPRLHAALNDLPTALLLASVGFDLLGAATRRAAFRQVGFWTLIAGVIGTVVAVVSGLQAEEYVAHGAAVHEVMETHELLGLVTLGIFVVLAIWRIARERRMQGAERVVAGTLGVGGVVMVVVTAVYGGRLVFDHAAGIPSEVLEAELQNRNGGHVHGAGAAHESPTVEAPTGTDNPAAADTPHTHAPGTPAHEH